MIIKSIFSANEAKRNKRNLFNSNQLRGFTLIERVPSKDWEVVV